tara:strand:- start:3521 stop:4462 length:942 start_codon:yes stop_codon:yes gene_type:complete
MSNSAEKFAIEWDQLGLPDKGSFDRKEKTGSTMFFYIRDALGLPDGTMINHIKLTDVSELGKLFRKSGHHLPSSLVNLPDDFFQSLEESEREFDRQAIISMWESIGVKFSFKSTAAPTTLIDVLDETMDIILAPVIVPHKNMQGFSVRVCVVSNSQQNTKSPTTAIIHQNWPIKWEEPYKDAVWTMNVENSIARPFSMKFRLAQAHLRPDLQSMITALAQTLSYNGCIVRCCQRIAPKVEITNRGRPSTKLVPRYDWYEYDHRIAEPIAPLEPEIVRDFVDHGDRRVRLEHASMPSMPGARWEQDLHYLGAPF